MSKKQTPEEIAAYSKAWCEAFKKARAYPPLSEMNLFDTSVHGFKYVGRSSPKVSEAIVVAPGVVFDDIVEIRVPELSLSPITDESSNCQVLVDNGFVFPEVEVRKGPSYKPYNMIATLLQNSSNLFYNGEKVVDLIVPTCGVAPLPRKYLRNLSIVMNGVRVIATGTGSFNLMGCAECPGDEDESIVLITLSSGQKKAVLISYSGVKEVASREAAFFRRDSSTNRRYLVYPSQLESSVEYESLKWVESLSAPGLVCIDGQFFSVPLHRLVHLRNVQTTEGSSFLTKNSDVVMSTNDKIMSEVVLCNLGCPKLSRPAEFHSPSNIATIEVVNKVRDSVVYCEMGFLYRTCHPVELSWSCQGYGVSYSDAMLPSTNLEQVRKRRHKVVSILLCMAHAVAEGKTNVSVFDVYKRMERLPEVFVHGRNYKRYNWSGICDDFWRYDHSSRLAPISHYYIKNGIDGGREKNEMPSEVVNVLVVCRSNFTLRGMNYGVYSSDAHFRMWKGKSDIVSMLWSLNDCRALDPKMFVYDMTLGSCDVELVSKGVRAIMHLDSDEVLLEDSDD